MDIKDYVREHKGGFDTNRIRGMFYGESGTGKTVFASTWPNPVFLNADDGLASVRLPVADIPISDWNTLYEVTEYLVEGNHPYQTIVVDSLNEIQHLCMQHILHNFPMVKRSYNSLPGVSDYGMMLKDVDDWVRLLKSLPLNVVFLTQVQPRQFDTDPVQPQLIGKNTASNISRMMDLIGYIFTEEGDDSEPKRYIAFNLPNYVTKDRSGALPPVFKIQHRDKAFEELCSFWV